MNRRTFSEIGILVAISWLAFQGDRGLLAQDPPSTETRAHRAVKALVAESWEVEGERILLDWGSVHSEALPAAFSDVELVGGDRHGHLVVAFWGEGPHHRLAQVVVRAGTTVTIPVAGRSLPRGVALGPGDVILKASVRWGEPDPQAPLPEEGWTTRRPIQKGEVLQRPAVAPPRVVVSGMPVTIIVRRGGLVLTLEGTASGHAEMGESVHVRTETGQRLRGIASGPGQVEIPNASLGGSP